MLFDTHAHYDDKKFLDDKFESLENAHNSGVSYIVNAASNLASSIESI
jgi:TatD DNase family protein